MVRIQDIIENKLFQYEGAVPFATMAELALVVGEQSHHAQYHLQLSRSGQFLLIKGAVDGVLTFPCDRCLERFDYRQQERFRITLSPAVSQTLRGDQDLSEDELEVGIYQGEWLDLLSIMEEQILLGLPMKKLCVETCQGICPQCGRHLNRQSCTCPPPDNSDHPFFSLQQ